NRAVKMTAGKDEATLRVAIRMRTAAEAEADRRDRSRSVSMSVAPHGAPSAGAGYSRAEELAMFTPEAHGRGLGGDNRPPNLERSPSVREDEAPPLEQAMSYALAEGDSRSHTGSAVPSPSPSPPPVSSQGGAS